MVRMFEQMADKPALLLADKVINLVGILVVCKLLCLFAQLVFVVVANSAVCMYNLFASNFVVQFQYFSLQFAEYWY